MKNLNKNELMKSKKFYLGFAFLFFFLVFSFSGVNASATISGVPDISMSYSQSSGFNVGSYSTNSNPASTQLSYIDPDTSSTVNLLAGGSSSNSEFDIALSTGNQVTITSKVSPLSSLSIKVTVCDVLGSCSPQVYDIFTLTISSSSSPVKISSIGTINLSDNNYQTLQGTNLFQSGTFNKIAVSYSDPVYLYSVSLSRTSTQTSQNCDEGGIKTCVTGGGTFPIAFTYTGNSFSATVTITAYNTNAGTSSSYSFLVVSSAPSGGGGGEVSTGNMWIADFNGGSHGYITKVNPDGTSTAYSLSGTFNYPHWIVVDNEQNMWIPSWGSGGIEKVSPDGSSVLFSSGIPPNVPTDVYNPSDDNIWFCSAATEDKVYRMSKTGTVVNVADLPSTDCRGMVYADGSVWASSGSTISRFYSNGTRIDYPGTTLAPNGMTFNGTDIFVGGAGIGNTKFSYLNVNSGTMTNVTVSGTATQPLFPFYDGEGSVWFESQGNAKAVRYYNNGTLVYYPGLGLIPYGSSYNPSQRAMWFPSRDSNIITKIYIDNGSMTNFSLGTTYRPHGLAFDSYFLASDNPPYGIATPTSAIPVKNLISYDGNINLNYGQSSSPFTISNYWSNFTYVQLSVYNTTSGTNSSLTFNAGSSYDVSFPEFNISTVDVSVLPLLITAKKTDYAKKIYISVCNLAGCNTTDFFGNRNVLSLNITGTLPTRLPLSFAVLGVQTNTQNSIDMNSYFSNYDYLKLNFVNPNNNSNYVLSSQNGTVNFESSKYNLLLTPTSMIVNAKDVAYTQSFVVSACNLKGCISTDTFGNNNTLTLSISTSGIAGGSSSGLNDAVAGTLNLFPDSSGLTSSQKATYVVLTMVIVTFIVLILGFLIGGELSGGLILLALVLDFFLVIFFTTINYISIGVIITIGLILLIFAGFKLFGGGN